MEIKYAIGIPTLNRADLLIPSLICYVKDYPDIKVYVLDNGNQTIDFKHPNIEIIEGDDLSVGASWNVLCKKIFEENDMAVILNDDIYLGIEQRFFERIMKNKFDILLPPPDWCVFLLPKTTYEKVGEFDECFYPAYFEDKSYEYRMRLSKLNITRTPKLIPFVYRSSQTLEKNPSIDNYRTKNQEQYLNMWGGMPQREKFKTPFNK